MDNPYIEYWSNGKIKSINYLNNIYQYHNIGNAAIIKFYKNGQIRTEEYWINNIYHREDGPAITIWYENGQKRKEIYCINGKYHREDGPASLIWYENGQIEIEEYFLNGLRLDKYDVRKIKLKNLNLI